MPIDVRMAQLGELFSDGVEPRGPLSPREKRLRREVLFAETLGESLRRRARALLRALSPGRIASLPAGLDFFFRANAVQMAGLPDPARALSRPDGLCGFLMDFKPETIIEGFARGLFPAADCGPLKWWSPANRQVLRPASCKLGNGARRLLRREDMSFSFDADFDATIAAHARAKKGWRSGRLFSPRGLNLLASLADLGYAHALDMRDKKGRLAAGAVGVAVGSVFITLGVFGRDADHADAALVVLNRHLRQKGFLLHDFVGDADVSRLGFAPMERSAFLNALARSGSLGRAERWKADPALCARNMPLPIREDETEQAAGPGSASRAA